jgi:di/tricarboxylate transporter
VTPVDPAVTSLVVLGLVVALFVWNRLPVGAVAVLTSLTLLATGVLDAEQALAGFGDPVVIFIASLFVVSEALDSTGVTTWAGQAVTERAGTGRARLTVVLMLLCALATALVTPNGAVAALLPMVVVLAARAGLPPALLLMPLAFAAHAGSLLALTGSPVNVIVSDAIQDAGGDGLGFVELAAVGLPLLVVTVLLAVWLGPRVVPRRAAGGAPVDLSRYATTVADRYGLATDLHRLHVGEASPLLGRPPAAVRLDGHPGLTLVGLQSASETPAPARAPLQHDDVLVVSGPQEEVARLVAAADLVPGHRPLEEGPRALLDRRNGVVEAVVPPRSPLVGETVFPGMMRGPHLLVLAVERLGKDRGLRPTTVAEGDVLLVHGRWPAIDALADDRDVLLVDSPALVRRQALPMGPRARTAVAVLAGMVVLLATGVVPPAVAGLAAATAMVLLRVVSPGQAYRSVSWQTVVLVGGLIPLSTAIATSGAADLLAGVIVDGVGQGRPLLLLAAMFALTAGLGQVISNTATVLVVVPVAVAAALETGVAVEPVLVVVAVAGAASLLTPIATPANMMVMGPGGYLFGDYWRLGLPVMAAWLAVTLVVVPLVWPLQA